MKHTLEQNKLTIYLEGELNSSNSEEIEKEIENIVNANKFQSLALDFDDLRYISSAGLRIIVSLKQRFDDITLVKVPKSIYQIFSMVGFQNIVKIETK